MPKAIPREFRQDVIRVYRDSDASMAQVAMEPSPLTKAAFSASTSAIANRLVTKSYRAAFVAVSWMDSNVKVSSLASLYRISVLLLTVTPLSVMSTPSPTQ
ncbi:hypothetical protein [Nocardioides mangrovicus]|uniref:hypothetical protein n=1 Tax=Nocardioides mangrovicus TaxID=2478913 RepID=UPI0011C35D03|nr:hypothetical protein [Nocardioides mangrovicus]